MSLPNPLQQLLRLDRFSSKFDDRICNILYGEEYQQCVPNLKNDDLAWLVEYLDKVRRRVSLLCSLLTPP